MNSNTGSDRGGPGEHQSGRTDERFDDDEFDDEYLDDTIDYEVDPEALVDDGDELMDEATPDSAFRPARDPDDDTAWEPDPDDDTAWEPDADDGQEWFEDSPAGTRDEEDRDDERGWPLGLISVALVAVILLVVGGYGVMQQRSEMREEIRQLRSALATAVQPEQAAADREALRQSERQVEGLKASIANLELENRSLQDTLAGLKTQLSQAPAAAPETPTHSAPPPTTPRSAPAPTTPKPAPTPAKPKPTPAPKPARAAPGVSDTDGWFVNFGSYSQRSAAESWAARLSPDSGTVVIAQGARDGRTFYRVRVVGLADRAEATRVSQGLEREFNLPKLWVGQQ